MKTTIRILPCSDSDAQAFANRHALALTRDVAGRLGHDAILFQERGEYVAPSGKTARIADLMAESVAHTVSIPPDAVLPVPPRAIAPATVSISVANETTFQAAERLAALGERPLALNFASGTSPGGGFLRGSTAQEETLVRSSGLYATIRGNPMYARHKQGQQGLASEAAILSPAVPVFRADDGTLLESPWLLDILTCAAPKANLVGLSAATPLMKIRIEHVLEIARAYGYRSLVLGAWGCGAYHNAPYAVARYFRDALTGIFLGAFDTVVFAIADWSREQNVLGPFRDIFAELETNGT